LHHKNISLINSSQNILMPLKYLNKNPYNFCWIWCFATLLRFSFHSNKTIKYLTKLFHNNYDVDYFLIEIFHCFCEKNKNKLFFFILFDISLNELSTTFTNKKNFHHFLKYLLKKNINLKLLCFKLFITLLTTFLFKLFCKKRNFFSPSLHIKNFFVL
jgi:hypothetical protein